MANLDFIAFEVLRDATGAAYTGAKASYWADVGLTTPLDTYSEASLVTPNTNPVVSDGTTGAFGAIYLKASRYWRTVTTSADVSLPQFNAGPLDGTLHLVTSVSAPSPAYPFLRYYSPTSGGGDGHIYRRNAANSAWIDEGLVDSLGNAATVTQQLAGTATDAFSTPDSVAALWQRGTDLASADPISLPATGGRHFNITGTATIAGIGSASGGRTVEFKFVGACPLTHHSTNFILPGGASLTTAAGDIFEFTNEAAQDATGSAWKCTKITRASGSPVNITDQIATQAQQETGTQITAAVTSGRQQYHQSACKCYGLADFAGSLQSGSYNIASVADTGVGRITFTIATDFSDANWVPVLGMENDLSAATADRKQDYTSKLAGSIEVRSYDLSGAALADAVSMSFAGFGDQA